MIDLLMTIVIVSSLLTVTTTAQQQSSVSAQVEFESELEKHAFDTVLSCGEPHFSYEVGTELWFWTEAECMHDMLYLKGTSICPTHDFCNDVNEYIISKGIADEPIPQDTWCNTNIDACIEKTKLERENMVDAVIIAGDDPDSSELVKAMDETIEELEQKQGQQQVEAEEEEER